MLTPRLWELLRLVYAHPLLTRQHGATFLQLDISTIRHLARQLLDAGFLRVIHGSSGDEHLALSEAGLRLLAASLHTKVQYLVDKPDPNSHGSPLEQRGLIGLRRHLAHTRGVYDFFAELASLKVLHFFETGILTVRSYRDQGEWYGLRPDAVAEIRNTVYRTGRPFRLFLEFDRGTMHSYDLGRKLDRYVRYFAAREWHRELAVPPILVFVLPEFAEERTLRRLALTHLAGLPTGVQVLTTTSSLLMLAGITGAIFLEHLPRQQSSSLLNLLPQSQRISLFAPFNARRQGDQP